MEKLSLISADLIHHDCWTIRTEKYLVNVKLLSQQFTNEKYFISKVLVLGKDSRGLINELRNFKKVKITKLDHLDKDSFVIDFLYPRHNSVSSLFYDTNSIVISHRIVDGIEKWKIITDSSLVNHVLERLEKTANLISFKEINIKKLGKLLDKLNDRSLSFLKIAYKQGLFDYPKRKTLLSLSKELGIKPNTLLYHIRKSESSLLEILIDEYYDLL
ncbi:helix-turn-helix domain-containing protein [Sulfolobus sp. E11-6]|uniref:helix-turn-helix domain-containing protein n=1 Tax=Sulfolobus sp. E11-6 TaxID=2663020 RepID=UPI00129556F1|nr:helix-turn-helix domain-containing protein [Sulfolobus sp. E11-6]QGA69109.1 XRE family transcriptional regulator [Sulfolobus sp. E11-6]